jgi:MFS family permease
LVDAYGRRVLFFGLIILTALSLNLARVDTFATFVLFGCLLGVASQLVYSSLKAYLLHIIPEGKSARYFGVLVTVFQAGLAVGPAAGGYLISGGLESGIAVASKILCADLILIIALSLAWGVGGIKSKEEIGDIVSMLLSGPREYLKLKHVGVMVLWLSILFTTYEGLVWTLEPLFTEYYSITPLAAGLILTAFTIPFILFNIPAGHLSDKYGKIKILVPGLLVAGAFVIIFGSVETTPLLMASAFISSAGLAAAWNSTAGLLADASTSFRKGRIVGVWNTSEEVGYIIGPIAGGLIAQHAGIEMPFMTIGALMILTAGVVLAVRRTFLFQHK